MNRSSIIAIAILAFAAVLPLFGKSYIAFVLGSAALYFIVAVSLNVLVGLSGQVSIGHAAFWALGAYGSALVVTKLGLPFWIGIAAGTLISTIFGIAVAIPALRIQGHYLAIATLAFALFIEKVLHEWEGLTGGRAGIFVPRPSLFGYQLSSDRDYYWLLLIVCALVAFIASNLQRSQTGRALQALRMSPTAAQSCGIDRRRAMIVVFGISAALCGLSGALYAHFIGYLSASTFSLETSLSFITMVVIGGTGSIAGALMAGLFLAIAPEVLRGFGTLQMVIYGVLLLLCVIFLPRGLASLPSVIRARLRSKQLNKAVR